MAYTKELEDIIEAALADGIITEKERLVIHKKAQLYGVDPDEIDVVIDGRLQQKYNEVEAAKQKIRKCPSCGEMIPAMTAICPNCGQVIDTSNPDNKALQNYMSELEGMLIKIKGGGIDDLAYSWGRENQAQLESLIRQGKALYGDNKKIAYLISEVEASLNEIVARKEKKEKQRKNLIIAGISTIVLIIIGLVVLFATNDDALEWLQDVLYGAGLLIIGVVFWGAIIKFCKN